MSYFSVLDLLPDDPILSLPRAFSVDTREKKANLGVGAYRTKEGRPYVLGAVQKAEQLLLQEGLNKEYLPIGGDLEFREASLEILLGKKSSRVARGEVFCAQMVGGTGALRVGASVMGEETRKIFIPDYSWPNHHVIFTGAGLSVETYPYYDPLTMRYNFSSTCEAVQAMPPGSTMLLHGCCHNPTGWDPTHEEWQELSELLKKQKVIPFFDFAYQGFGEGLEKDAYAIRLFANEGHEMLVATSFSKNFGLYGERLGLLIALTHGEEAVEKVRSHIKHFVRSLYSSPPAQGARIVKTILKNKELYHEWVNELEAMRGRIIEMRDLFSDHLTESLGRDFSFIKEQKGMFCFCGLTQEQANELKTAHGVYLPENGRINVAALTPANLSFVVEAIVKVQK